MDSANTLTAVFILAKVFVLFNRFYNIIGGKNPEILLTRSQVVINSVLILTKYFFSTVEIKNILKLLMDYYHVIKLPFF